MAKKINEQQLLQLVEAAIFASDKPLSVNDLQSTVLESFELTRKRLQQALAQLQQDYSGRGIQL
ncbi:MAG: SMC-Scp complex subunit ScpB, partial [Gammaproteobacteria bacterium]|nr:SMC-Scp complex subunit ScpB [Gammaproteobacteria bacterium]